MLSKPKDYHQMSFYSTFEEQLNHQHPLYQLANTINWQQFEESFKQHYSDNTGAPAKPIRLMVSLLILKHLRNLSDESVVEQWSENAYYQYFSGEKVFASGVPCVATELVEFRKRIGEKGIELILKESVRINGKDSLQKEGTTDTTVQEKNITYPTDTKLHRKIITRCKTIAARENLELRQSYTRTIKKLLLQQRFRNHPANRGKARKASKKIKVIAGRLVRELERKLPAVNNYLADLELFKKILSQKREDKQKIYSIHEPDVQCISKGKEHKKYEFGNKVSVLVTQKTGVIVGALSFTDNLHDSKTLNAALNQHQRITGIEASDVYVDRGYPGPKQIRNTQIHLPKPDKTITQSRRAKHKRRAAIEPVIGHLKHDYRMVRNFLKGSYGDAINLMMAASAMNFKRMMNLWKKGKTIFANFFNELFNPFFVFVKHGNQIQALKTTF